MFASFRPDAARANRLSAVIALAAAGCKLSLDLESYAFVGSEDSGQGIGPLSPLDAGEAAATEAGVGDEGGALAPPLGGSSPSCESCSLPHADARCTGGRCVLEQCVGPWRDDNGVAEDGCESGDVPGAGLTLWFMADRGVTIEGEGRVSLWVDQSPNRYAAVQGVQAQMPSLVVRNGLDMVSFDGSDDALALPAGFASFPGAAFFAVVEAEPNELCAGILHFSNGADADDVEFGRHRPNRLYYEVVGDFVEGAPQAFEAGRRFVVSIVQADADAATGNPGAAEGAVELRINGALTGSKIIPLPASVRRTQNYLGRNAYTSNLDVCTMFFRGAIGEVIFFPRELSAAEREGVERYLTEKWLP